MKYIIKMQDYDEVENIYIVDSKTKAKKKIKQLLEEDYQNEEQHYKYWYEKVED